MTWNQIIVYVMQEFSGLLGSSIYILIDEPRLFDLRLVGQEYLLYGHNDFMFCVARSMNIVTKYISNLAAQSIRAKDLSR